MRIDTTLTLESLKPRIDTLWALSAAKIRTLENAWAPAQGTPVFTAAGVYTTRGWT